MVYEYSQNIVPSALLALPSTRLGSWGEVPPALQPIHPAPPGLAQAQVTRAACGREHGLPVEFEEMVC